MHRRYWREIVEIVGVVSIVAALLLVALQLREANRIAAADTEVQLAQRFRSIHILQATNTEFAKLFPKLAAPQNHLITATEDSQIEGLARQYMTLFASVQTAWESGALSRSQFDDYLLEVDGIVGRYPGLQPQLRRIYETSPALQGKEVFRAIAQLNAPPPPENP